MAERILTIDTVALRRTKFNTFMSICDALEAGGFPVPQTFYMYEISSRYYMPKYNLYVLFAEVSTISIMSYKYIKTLNNTRCVCKYSIRPHLIKYTQGRCRDQSCGCIYYRCTKYKIDVAIS